SAYKFSHSETPDLGGRPRTHYLMRLLPRVRPDGSAGSRNGTRASAAAEDRGNATCHTVCNSSEAEDSCGAAGRAFSYGLQMGFWRGQSGCLHLYPSSLSSLPRYYHHIHWRCRSTASLPFGSRLGSKAAVLQTRD